WSAEEIALLEDLTASVMTEIDILRESGARAQSEARVTRILEGITDAFFALDREWRFSYVNRAAEGLLQRSRSDLLGRSIWDEFPEAVGTVFETEYSRAVREDVTVAFETRFAPLDIWVSIHAYPSEDGLSVYF